MKRFVSVFLCCLFFVAIFILPVMASTTYVLNYNSTTYKFTMRPFPSGFFDLSVSPSDGASFEPFVISRIDLPVYSDLSEPGTYFYRDITVVSSYGDIVNLLAFSILPSGHLQVGFMDDGEYVPVDAFVSLSPSPKLFHEHFTPELLEPVFRDVISLLPVVTLCIVGFVGVRKGISFLIDVLRSS